MKRMFQCFLFLACLCAAVACVHAKADAAPACAMNQSSLADLILGYDPPLSTTTTAVTISANTLAFTCSGLGTGNASHVYVLLNGSTGASYTAPFLTGPNSFQLTYKPCVPGTGTCNGTTNLWQNTMATAFKMTNAVNGVNTINQSFSIFVGRQDAYVGTTAQYAGSLYFSFICGDGGSQTAC